MNLKKKLSELSENAGMEFIKDIKILEHNMIVIQENQIEEENYLKTIVLKLDEVNLRLKRLEQNELKK
jgi:hypothetical protein